jgi:cytochrome c-type biogenesis protein CcmH/NrfG
MSHPGRRRILPAVLFKIIGSAWAVTGLCGAIVLSGCTGGATPGTDPEADAAVLRTKVEGLKPPEIATPQRGETYLDLGKRMLAAREPDLAMGAFLTSMTAEGITPEAMTGAGIAAESQGMMTLARRYFEKACELAPNSIMAQNNLGVVLYKLKEYDLARDAFRTAYALSSGKSEMAGSNLNLAEAKVAAMGDADGGDAAATHEVVRLGTSEFRLIETRKDGPEIMAAD